MATKDVQPLDRKKKPKPPMSRQFSADESVHELLVLLRKQEESPDEAILNETKCLLSLSLDRNTMPPLPSIKSKKNDRIDSSDKRGNDNTHKLKTPTVLKQDLETSPSSDDEVSDATLIFTPVSSTSAKRRLPSLGSMEESGTTGMSKTKPQSRKT